MSRKLIISVLFCFGLLTKLFVQCTPNKNSAVDRRNNVFIGDPKLGGGDLAYFSSITKPGGAQILHDQNTIYQNHFAKYQLERISLERSACSVELVKALGSTQENMQVHLFTFVNNKKMDSVQFYSNISGDGYGAYNCLSYFDPKSAKIWQIKYFPSKANKTADIISYSAHKIDVDGTIKLDSLYYLDEAWDAEMEKYQLYY